MIWSVHLGGIGCKKEVQCRKRRRKRHHTSVWHGSVTALPYPPDPATAMADHGFSVENQLKVVTQVLEKGD